MRERYEGLLLSLSNKVDRGWINEEVKISVEMGPGYRRWIFLNNDYHSQLFSQYREQSRSCNGEKTKSCCAP